MIPTPAKASIGMDEDDDLMHRAADEGIALVLLDGNGRFQARLEGPVSGNVLLRTAQFEQARDPAFTLSLARNFVAGRIRNCRQVRQSESIGAA